MSGMLMDERFVAVFPSLVRRLGSLESAVILQHLHWSADEDGGIRITQQQVADETGIGLRTVERRLRSLRDEGYVTAERAAAYDATLVYRIETARLADSSSHPAKVADSDPAKVADSSLQKAEASTQVGVDPPARLAHEHRRHPSRSIDGWQPEPALVRYLEAAYPHVSVPDSGRRFFNFHFARQDTSKSWDALFENWVSNDEDRAVAQTLGGTDDRGVPLNQSGKSVVPGALKPGDDGYFNPFDD